MTLAIPAPEPVDVSWATMEGEPHPDPNRVDPEDAAALTKLAACAHCGGRHTRACPRVKKFRYHPGGGLAEVVFWRKWSTDHVLFDDDLDTEPQA